MTRLIVGKKKNEIMHEAVINNAVNIAFGSDKTT